MKELNKLLWLALISLSFFVTSCDPDDPEPLGKYENGILIANEGVFNAGNGSISYYDFAKDSVSNEIFKAENNRPLGDVVQSVTKYEDRVLIAVNNSNKVEIVNASDFKSVATVDVMKPRYIVVENDRAYVTSWADGGKVYVISMDSYTVIDSVEVRSAPEGLVVADGKLYVANTGWGNEQTVSIINLSNNSVVKTLNVDADSPAQLVKDKDGMIWILASGKVIYDQSGNVVGHTPSALIQLNPATDLLEKYIRLFDELHPLKLGINKAGDKIYYGGGFGFQALYAINITDDSAPATAFIEQPNYGFVIDRVNDEIFLLQEAYTANGKMIRYDASGKKLGEYTVGIYPTNGAKRFPY